MGANQDVRSTDATRRALSTIRLELSRYADMGSTTESISLTPTEHTLSTADDVGRSYSHV